MSDLISRQAAIDIFEPWLKVRGYSEGELNMLKAVLYELRFLPSVQPEILACGEGELNVPDTNVGDMIHRQAAIDALGEEPEVWVKEDDYARGLSNQWRYDVTALKAVPSAQPEQRWIPCSESLPEYGKPVLWCNEKGSVFITAITAMNEHSWAVGKRHRFCQVVAWMPLPEPWKGEKE